MSKNIVVPELDDPRILRHVNVDGYRLLTWETRQRFRTGQLIVGYAFYEPGIEEPLFCGEDYGCSPLDCVDSDNCLRGIMGYLTLREGDTDREYFDNYTERQLKWSRNKAEELTFWGMEESDFCDGDGEAPKFIDIE